MTNQNPTDWYVDTSLHTTISLPGSCNAKCKFCYDLYRSKYKGDYIADLEDVLRAMPDTVHKLALTGMETTLSPYIEDVLKLLQTLPFKEHFKFKFLNTNGTRLLKLAPLVNETLNAVNISRHAADDEANYTIFNTRSVPSTAQLKETISNLTIPVNINYVLAEGLTEDEMIQQTGDMVALCKEVGAASLTIRFMATDLLRKDPLPNFLKAFPTVKKNGNPGCTYWYKDYNGFPLILRYTTIDPTYHTNWDYGFIVQSDLTVTRDWAGNKPRQRQKGKYI